ncbi:MAG TPA: hypothetical protein V6D07_18745 [Trichocoleus sp.]
MSITTDHVKNSFNSSDANTPIIGDSAGAVTTITRYSKHTATFTPAPGTMHSVSTAGGALSITLPAGIQGDIVGFCDQVGINPAAPTGFGLNSFTINPPAGGTIQGLSGTNGQLILQENETICLRCVSPNNWRIENGLAQSAPIPGIQYCQIEDQKPSGTEGGSYTAGSWATRVLNTKTVDEINVSLAANQFTLPGATKPGKYLISWSSPGAAVNRFNTRLWNVNSSVQEKLGQSSWAPQPVNGEAKSVGFAIVSITANTTYRIEFRAETSNASYGLGVNNGSITGAFEVYTQVSIQYLDGTRNVSGGGITATAAYDSGELSFATPSLQTLTHGLGAAPSFVKMYLVCKTAELGFVVGDILDVTGTPMYNFSGPVTYGMNAAFNETQIKVVISGLIAPIRPDTQTMSGTITPANWRLVVKAWR